MKNNPPVDRRIQRTRQLLLDALVKLILEKGYESITVQDIIDCANVGRSTFYSHFQDKEALLLSGSENMLAVFEKFQKSPTPENAGWDLMLVLFQHAEENRLLFKALFGKQGGAILPNYMRKMLTASLKEHFQKAFPKKNPPVPLDVFVQYFVNSFFGLLVWWLDNDAAYTAEQMYEYFRKLTEPSAQAVVGNVN